MGAHRYLKVWKKDGETFLEKVYSLITYEDFKRIKKRQRAAYKSRRINRLVIQHRRN